MSEPRFKVGDAVRVHAVSSLGPAEAFLDATAHDGISGTWVVTAVLPEEMGQSQYRIRRSDPPQERIVRESQLVPLARKP